MDQAVQISQRLEWVESRFELLELASSYAVACDDHDIPLLKGLFTEDAEFNMQNGTMALQGREAIVERFAEVFKARGPSYHWTHDHLLRFDSTDPDRATGLVLGHAETCSDGEVSVAAMRYHDEYLRSGGQWKFRKRVLGFLYYVPVREFSTSLAASLRVGVAGRRLLADYPESLESWQSFQRAHMGNSGV